MKQIALLKNQNKAYGGELQMTRKGRQVPRPIDRTENYKKIKAILAKFTTKYGIQILSMASVGNHLHLHIKLNNRYTY